MTKIFSKFFLVLVAIITFDRSALAQSEIKMVYGMAQTINLSLEALAATDLVTNATCATGDITIMKDQGAEASTTNCFVDRGKGYSLALTAAETTATRLTIYVVDQTNPKAWADKVIQVSLADTAPTGTADAGCTAPCNTITLDATAPSTNDIYNNSFSIAIVGGAGNNQLQCITDYNGTSKEATVANNWVTAPDATSKYLLMYTPNCKGALPANAITSGVLDSTATTELVDGVFNNVYETEGSITFGQFLKYSGAVMFGRSSNNGLTFKTPNNAATRVTSSVDANKNRTAITLSP